MHAGLLRDVLSLLLGFLTGVLSALFGIGGAIVSNPGLRALGAAPLAHRVHPWGRGRPLLACRGLGGHGAGLQRAAVAVVEVGDRHLAVVALVYLVTETRALLAL
jgi:hypothetical protein